MYGDEFPLRLAQLRIQKGVSAREMSLALGQNHGYINAIENGTSLPSMTVFFYICEYFKISPLEFFDTEIRNPSKVNELYSIAQGLSDEQLDNLIGIAKGLRK